mmetsp:Transcript_2683/g.5758  ORF Transcript_2683/g.5758 Transcript_2683/m.5758 type:complete len:248 (-) Transcript_2683:266-1009(-)
MPTPEIGSWVPNVHNGLASPSPPYHLNLIPHQGHQDLQTPLLLIHPRRRHPMHPCVSHVVQEVPIQPRGVLVIPGVGRGLVRKVGYQGRVSGQEHGRHCPPPARRDQYGRTRCDLHLLQNAEVLELVRLDRHRSVLRERLGQCPYLMIEPRSPIWIFGRVLGNYDPYPPPLGFGVRWDVRIRQTQVPHHVIPKFVHDRTPPDVVRTLVIDPVPPVPLEAVVREHPESRGTATGAHVSRFGGGAVVHG